MRSGSVTRGGTTLRKSDSLRGYSLSNCARRRYTQIMMANRIGRLELLFWWVASILGGGIMLAIVATLTNTTIKSYPLPLQQALPLIAVSILMLKAALSRFHDIGWPGWGLLLMFVPLVNVLAVLFLATVPGQKGANPYGEPTVFPQRLRKIGSGQVAE